MTDTSNPSYAEALLPQTREAFVFLCELVESGNVPRYGLESSQERINALLLHVLQESLNILRHEDETLSVEQLGGRTAVRKLVEMQHAIQELPEEVRPILEKTLSQQINEQNRGKTKPLLPRRSKKFP